MKRGSFVLSIGLLLLAGITLMYGQDTMGDKKSSSKSMSSSESVTGCLQKGTEPNGFTLTGDDGKVWELRSTKVKLSEHVGHKVTVMGASTPASGTTEKKIGDSETKETAGKDHGDLKVTSLKMVSDSCQ